MSANALPPNHLDREFLPIRAKILEIAAALDRIERSADENRQQTADDPRWEQLQEGIKLLQARAPQRAEQVQLLFSRPFNEQWRHELGMSVPSMDGTH